MGRPSVEHQEDCGDEEDLLLFGSSGNSGMVLITNTRIDHSYKYWGPKEKKTLNSEVIGTEKIFYFAITGNIRIRNFCCCLGEGLLVWTWTLENMFSKENFKI